MKRKGNNWEFGGLRKSILAEIERKPQTIKEITESLGAERTSVNTAVYTLESKGLVKRVNVVRPAKWGRTDMAEADAPRRANYLNREQIATVLKRVEILESVVQTQRELLRVLSKELRKQEDSHHPREQYPVDKKKGGSEARGPL